MAGPEQQSDFLERDMLVGFVCSQFLEHPDEVGIVQNFDNLQEFLSRKDGWSSDIILAGTVVVENQTQTVTIWQGSDGISKNNEEIFISMDETIYRLTNDSAKDVTLGLDMSNQTMAEIRKTLGNGTVSWDGVLSKALAHEWSRQLTKQNSN